MVDSVILIEVKKYFISVTFGLCSNTTINRHFFLHECDISYGDIF